MPTHLTHRERDARRQKRIQARLNAHLAPERLNALIDAAHDRTHGVPVRVMVRVRGVYVYDSTAKTVFVFGFWPTAAEGIHSVCSAVKFAGYHIKNRKWMEALYARESETQKSVQAFGAPVAG
jgi:hypothetical protein